MACYLPNINISQTVYSQVLRPFFKRYAPQAEFVWMERSGSFSHLEEPETVLALVRRFVRVEPA